MNTGCPMSSMIVNVVSLVVGSDKTTTLKKSGGDNFPEQKIEKITCSADEQIITIVAALYFVYRSVKVNTNYVYTLQ